MWNTVPYQPGYPTNVGPLHPLAMCPPRGQAAAELRAEADPYPTVLLILWPPTHWDLPWWQGCCKALPQAPSSPRRLCSQGPVGNTVHYLFLDP